jgi:hypothetical protein
VGIVLRKAGQITSRIIIAAAAVLALMLAVFIGLAIIQDPQPVGICRILRASSIAATFIVMAFMMISYLIRKFGINGRS